MLSSPDLLRATGPVHKAGLAAALLALLGLTACGRPASEGAASAPASAPAAAAATAAASAAQPAPTLLLSEVDVRTVAPGLLSSGPVITGSVQPERRAELRSEVAAVVTQVLKDNGEPVAAGELLVRLDDTTLRENLASTEEAVRAGTQALEQAERSASRLRTLQSQGMASVQALEDAEQRRVALNSDLVAARARVATARQQLRRTEVRAPFAGVLSERTVSVGDTASIGKALAKVIDPRSMRFEGQVSADRMHELKPGQVVTFRVNGHTPDVFVGSVKRVDATANAATRQVEVQVSFKDATTAPRVAGLFAEGQVETIATPVLMLPESALVRSGESVQVWKLAAGSISRQTVKTGARDARSGEWPVLQGLVAGDRVLRNPGSGLREGQKVEFSKPVAAAGLPGAAAPAAAAPASAASR
jgi:membrane fusion protein, multidrug efflux system